MRSVVATIVNMFMRCKKNETRGRAATVTAAVATMVTAKICINDRFANEQSLKGDAGSAYSVQCGTSIVEMHIR